MFLARLDCNPYSDPSYVPYDTSIPTDNPYSDPSYVPYDTSSYNATSPAYNATSPDYAPSESDTYTPYDPAAFYDPQSSMFAAANTQDTESSSNPANTTEATVGELSSSPIPPPADKE